MKFSLQRYLIIILSLILLVIFIIPYSMLIFQVYNCDGKDTSACVSLSRDGRFVITLIGGLISAYVISRFAVTPRGKDPGKITFYSSNGEAQQKSDNNLGVMTYVFLIVWVIMGFCSVTLGMVLSPEIDEMLNTHGKEWIASAVGAFAAYIGIDPPTLGRIENNIIPENE